MSVGYINEFEIVDDKRSGKIVVELNGRLNKCGVISPRYDLKLKDFEKFISSRKQVPPPEGYISKPIDREKLLATVARLLG